MTNDTDLLRKITALLAKADSTDSEAEASAFYAKAQELMLKYAVDEQALREAQGACKTTERPVLVDYMYSTNDRNAVGRKHLVNMCAKASGVKMIDYGNQRHSNRNRPGNEGVASQWCGLIGFASDIEVAKLLYVSLLVQASRFGAGDWRALGESRGQSRFMTGYLCGFAARVGQRLAEGKQALPQTSTALIVRKDAEVDEAFVEFFPRVRIMKGPSIDARGHLMGRMAGDRADVGSTRVGASRQRLVGAGS